MFVMYSLIVVSMLGVVFETAILTAISPVALSTLVNSQARSTGISFIKNFAAVSMQWGVLAICFEAFNTISTGLTLDFASGLAGDGLLANIMQYATPVLCVIMLAIIHSSLRSHNRSRQNTDLCHGKSYLDFGIRIRREKLWKERLLRQPL